MDYENATDEDWVAAKIEEEKDGETNEAWISYITSKYDDMLLKVSSFKINESTVTQTATMGAESMSMDLPSNIYELNIVALEMVLHFQDENTIYFIYKTWGEDLGGGETTENIQLLYIFKALPQE